MDSLFDAIRKDLLDPKSLIGALFYGVVFFGLATGLAVIIRRTARRVEPRLSDVTGFRFVSAFAQLLSYLVGFILYAHLIPELRALGTALLAGASVVSIVVGLAAQNTLGNLVAGLSLVLYRPIRVGDNVQMNSPSGYRYRMLTPMKRAGGLPANLKLRMGDEGRLVARHIPFPLAHGRVSAVPSDNVYYGKRESILE